jgi:prepilin-type N-terminal cleavage/methylation domain-containing protein
MWGEIAASGRPFDRFTRGMPNLRSDDRGFTLIEVLMASVVLLVGILGVVTLVNTANGATTSTKAREQGLALARDLTEAARSVRYQSLEPATIAGKLQAMPGFTNTGGPGWTINRRGIRYTVSFGVCSVDDPSDGTGAHAANLFCVRPAVQASAATCKSLIGFPPKINGTGGGGADAGDCGLDTDLNGTVDGLVQAAASGCPSGTSVAAGTCDSQPNDFKRLVTLVTWDRGSGSRYVIQQATVPFPGLSAYAAIDSFVLNGYPVQSGAYVVGDTPTSLTFAATTSQPAQQVNWLLGTTDQGPFTAWSGSSGTTTWSLGAIDLAESKPPNSEVLDGTYVVGARVQDAGGIHGIERDVTVKLNRRVPFAPPNFSIAAGALDAQGRPTSVTATWGAPPDRDVVGYSLERRVGGGGAWQAVTGCDNITARTCTDTSPPMSSVDYHAVALDTDPSSGTVRGGIPSVMRTVFPNNAPPSAPTITGATAVAGTTNTAVSLSWSASTDADDALDLYEIRRNCGSGYVVAVTQLGTATTVTDTSAPKSATCYYGVRAKDVGGIYSSWSPDYRVNT